MWKAILVMLGAGPVAVPAASATAPCWSDEDSPIYRDYSVITEDLPPLRAAWQKRGTVPYRGVVPVALNARAGGLAVTFVAPIAPGEDYPGALEEFPLLVESESPPWGNTFAPLWQDRRTGRSLGPIHAAVRVKPRFDSPESERRQVVVYHPPDRADILLVATRIGYDDAWTPLLRVDMPRATRFDVIQTGWH